MEGLHALVSRPGFDEIDLALLRSVLGLTALLALLIEPRRRPVPRSHRAIAATLAVASVIAFFQFFQVGYREFYHRWDFLQEYVGARHPELAYTHFYECIAVAESELPDGTPHPSSRPAREARARSLRDLHAFPTTIVSASAAVDDPAHCHDLFTPARWESFRLDVAFFRGAMDGTYWRDAQKDHGYAGTPTHGVLTRLLIPDGPTTTGRLQWLAALDPALDAVMFGLVAWAFGWRVMCLSVVFWGVQDLGPFHWMGGAFLWQDWLVCLVASVCLSRRRHFVAAGALLALGAWLRLLPLFFFAGPLVMLAVSLARRTFSPALARFFAGAALASTLLGGATWLGQGASTWPAWGHHIARHQYTVRDNHVSWLTLATFRPATRKEALRAAHPDDVPARWNQGRFQAYRERRWLVWSVRLLGLALVALACRRVRNLHMSIPLGVVPLFLLLDLPCYHLIALLPLCLLTRARPALAVALILAAVLTQVCHLHFALHDDRYTAMSLVVAALLTFVLVVLVRRARGQGPSRSLSQGGAGA